MSHTKLHQVWLGMKDRCYCENDTEYKNYGGRGIRVCDDWLGKDGAKNFIEWSFKNGYIEGLSIDRIDVNGNYSPDNCRWANTYVQANNRQNTLWVEYKEKRMSLKQLCDEVCINYHTVYNRIRNGYSVKDAIRNFDYRSVYSGKTKDLECNMDNG